MSEPEDRDHKEKLSPVHWLCVCCESEDCFSKAVSRYVKLQKGLQFPDWNRLYS